MIRTGPLLLCLAILSSNAFAESDTSVSTFLLLEKQTEAEIALAIEQLSPEELDALLAAIDPFSQCRSRGDVPTIPCGNFTAVEYQRPVLSKAPFPRRR